MNDTPNTEVKETKTGKQRAEERLQAKKVWQSTYYAKAGTGELSRQFKRRLKRMVASKELAEKKLKALKNRSKGQARNF